MNKFAISSISISFGSMIQKLQMQKKIFLIIPEKMIAIKLGQDTNFQIIERKSHMKLVKGVEKHNGGRFQS